MDHKTAEYQLAEELAKKVEDGKLTVVPTAYAQLTKEHYVRALSIDGMVRLAKKVADQHQAVVEVVGSSGGCYTQSEKEALAEFRQHVKLYY